ncbi:MAG TPA: TIGR02611 family protein, partial [Microbacteriaceae bacterium]|nr:TIGR02611 family protein [Microbacteriaceae bacterium]
MSRNDDDLEHEVEREIAEGTSASSPLRRWAARRRAWVDLNPRFRFAYRVVIASIGAIIVIVGLLLVPLPGPGWLIVFLGLSLLGTEFHWARRLTVWTRARLERVLR